MSVLVETRQALRDRGIEVALKAIADQNATMQDCLDAKRWALAPGRLEAAPGWLRVLLDTGRARHLSGTCKFCGCQDLRACPGGCAWVDGSHTICSRCVDRVRRPQ